MAKARLVLGFFDQLSPQGWLEHASKLLQSGEWSAVDLH